jgi:hypothetical protein
MGSRHFEGTRYVQNFETRLPINAASVEWSPQLCRRPNFENPNKISLAVIRQLQISNIRIDKTGALLQTLLQCKSNKCYTFRVCVCSLRYPACNAHAPYCHLWYIRLYNIFPHYLINSTIFEKKFIGHKMCVLIFSSLFVWNISHFKKNWETYDHICILVST